MLKIFISSSMPGASLARRLAKDLEQRGFLTYLPSRDIEGAADNARLDQCVAEAGTYLVLVEPNPSVPPERPRSGWLAEAEAC